VNANYLLPAGASLIHPHMQMLITPEPYSYQRRLLEAADRYYEEKGSSYFADLIDEEKRRGSRYIAQTGEWHWMTAFSPMGTNEIMAVHEEKADFASLSDEEITDLASGISRILSFYQGLGHMSFNYTLFSTRESAGHDGSRCLFKIITRQNLYPNYRNDDYFLQKLLQSELIFTLPEELAEGVRTKF
jgi:galactose-1-phosphate uridylyltransferase